MFTTPIPPHEFLELFKVEIVIHLPLKATTIAKK